MAIPRLLAYASLWVLEADLVHNQHVGMAGQQACTCLCTVPARGSQQGAARGCPGVQQRDSGPVCPHSNLQRQGQSSGIQLSQLHERVPCLPTFDHLLGQAQHLRASGMQAASRRVEQLTAERVNWLSAEVDWGSGLVDWLARWPAFVHGWSWLLSQTTAHHSALVCQVGCSAAHEHIHALLHG